MKFTQLGEAEIFTIIDAEISQDKLDPACHAEAERESNGNYDLMISRYFLKRVEMLRVRQEIKTDRAKALDRRKMTSSVHLVRYKSTDDENPRISARKKFNSIFTRVIANIILLLSSLSVVGALHILNGSIIQNLSYLFVIGAALACLVLPYLCSISLKKCHIPYQTCLSVMCIIMCMGSMASGILLMKKDPQNYAVDQGISLDEDSSEQVEINIEPAISGGSVVKAENPIF